MFKCHSYGFFSLSTLSHCSISASQRTEIWDRNMEIQVVRGLRYRIKKERLGLVGGDKGHSKSLPGHGTHLGLILKGMYVPPNFSSAWIPHLQWAYFIAYHFNWTLEFWVGTSTSPACFWTVATIYTCSPTTFTYPERQTEQSAFCSCHFTEDVPATSVIVFLFSSFLISHPCWTWLTASLYTSLTMWSDSPPPSVTILHLMGILSSAFPGAVFGIHFSWMAFTPRY